MKREACFQKLGTDSPLKGKSVASRKVELQCCPEWQFALDGKIYYQPIRQDTEDKAFMSQSVSDAALDPGEEHESGEEGCLPFHLGVFDEKLDR